MMALRYRDWADRVQGGGWWSLAIATAVPLALLAGVHAMYWGECIRLGRVPTPVDSTIWPMSFFLTTMLLYLGSFLAIVVVGIAAAQVAAGERGRGRGLYMVLALTCTLVIPAWIAGIFVDPFGAFEWWFD